MNSMKLRRSSLFAGLLGAVLALTVPCAAEAAPFVSAVDFVKSSYFTGHPEATAGEILDGYPYCHSGEWEEGYDSYGSVVFFSCELHCKTGMCSLEAKFRINRRRNAMALSYIRLDGYHTHDKSSYGSNQHMLNVLISKEAFKTSH